jgi:tetratricopeptide (TPR) repeat protein
MTLLEKGEADWFVAASCMLYAAAALGRPAAAASIAQEILALPFEPDPTGPYATAMSNLFGGLMALGQLDTALGIFDRLDRVESQAKDVDPVFSMLLSHLRGAVAVIRLNFGKALREARGAVERADAIGHSLGRVTARLDLALMMTELGSFEEAEVWAREATAIAADVGATLMRGWGTLYVAFAMIRGDKPREGIAQASLALGTLDDASARLTLAEAHLRLGEMDAAERYAREAREGASRALTAPWLVPQATLVLAQVEQSRGRLEEALALTERALLDRDCFASPVLPVRMLTVHAELLDALGRREQARRSAREARERVEGIAATIDDPELRRSYLAEAPNALAITPRWRTLRDA